MIGIGTGDEKLAQLLAAPERIRMQRTGRIMVLHKKGPSLRTGLRVRSARITYRCCNLG